MRADDVSGAMTLLRGSIPISASAQGRIRLVLVLTATAGLLAAAATLGTNSPGGKPVIGKPSAIVSPVRSGSDPTRGLTHDWVPWSSPAPATRSARVSPQQCSDRNFVDDAGALPSPCRIGVSAPAQSLV